MTYDFPILNIGRRYADSFSGKHHLIMLVTSLITFISMILFAFIPLTQRIETSGYSTSNLQQAETRQEVEIILTAFAPLMDEVRLLSIADYIFILAGFFLFFSIHSLIYLQMDRESKFILIPQIGMVLTIISRLLDSLENFWVIIIYSNPSDYPSFLIPITNYTETSKWIVVNIEYSVLLLNIVIFIWIKIFKNSTKTNSDEIN